MATADRDADPAYIVQSITLSALAFVFVIAFAMALYFERRIAPNKSKYNAYGGGNNSKSNANSNSGLDWWCRRVGLVHAIVCVVWAVDSTGALGLYPESAALALRALVTGTMFAFASLWLYFHSVVVFRQLQRPYPLLMRYALFALPAIDWVRICTQKPVLLVPAVHSPGN